MQSLVYLRAREGMLARLRHLLYCLTAEENWTSRLAQDHQHR